MKEIYDIVQAYEEARRAGKAVALVTVVLVEGSSYRRPGARMLVTEDGQLTGAISGGCLEGDARRKALLAIHQQKNKLIRYDTSEDDPSLGVQLGCNGIIYLLIEPIIGTRPNHPLIFLEKIIARRQSAQLVTLFSLQADNEQAGTCVLQLHNAEFSTSPAISADAANLAVNLTREVPAGTFCISELDIRGTRVLALSESLVPPVSIVIFGAGNDAMPLSRMAGVLGWNITIVDGRTGYATPQRFPDARALLTAKPAEALANLQVDRQTVLILMTHNYNYDLLVLREAIKTESPYIGALGPARKLERMLNQLSLEGLRLKEEQTEKLFGPAGLDIGAETSEEIALSIISEIKTVLSQKTGTSLRQKISPIHEPIHIIHAASIESSAYICSISAEQDSPEATEQTKEHANE